MVAVITGKENRLLRKEESHGLEKQGLRFRHKRPKALHLNYQAKLLNASMLLEVHGKGLWT